MSKRKVGKVTIDELYWFTTNMAHCLDAGMPFRQALDILSIVDDSLRSLTPILKQVRQELEGGSTLSDALKKFPKVFDDVYVNLVAAGEVGGTLDTTLNRLATLMRRNRHFAVLMRHRPLSRRIKKNFEIYRFASVLGTLITSGVPILDSLEITQSVFTDPRRRNAIGRVRKAVSAGTDLVTPLFKEKVLPGIVCKVIAVGEQTGASDSALLKIADFYYLESFKDEICMCCC